MSSFVDSLNRATMASSVDEYLWSDELEHQELMALALVRDRVKGRPILDLGVGAGRTVKGLREVSQDYLGVDYIEEMVSRCQKRFPDVRFEQADARSMPQFKDGSFALVVFSCNGIGMVDHEGRIAILKEVYRLLEPNGHFIFSTSNLNSENARRLLALPPFAPSKDPFRNMVRGARFAGQTVYRAWNRVRFKRHEIHHGDYKVLNDVCHHYRTMAYFITLENQRKQLAEAGFRPEPVVFDLSGRRVMDDTSDGTMTLVVTK